ncbi:uncharacterized protein LOC112602886 [Melanaphis sacchari]|uniref:uncharacterized protein LOC112602886 n=1 Tax=Melanaphis sacchari TaxID=742174 RepID=UPI000DC157D1|nr:uncharacterized protein LOC112602886 [Melanaphis sacchari]
MNRIQICLMLAMSCLMLVSAHSGSYNYGYGVNDPITGELNDQRETKICDDQVYDEPMIPVSKNFVSEPITSPASPGPIINAEFVSVTPSSILRTADFESSRIVAATPILETKIAAEPLLYASRPAEYTPIAKHEPLPKYAPRVEYYAASPAPLTASKLQTQVVQYQVAPVKIVKSANLQSYGRQTTSSSHKSFVNHPPTPVKIASIAPEYYAPAPKAPEYYAPALTAREYYLAASKAPEYNSAAPKAPEYNSATFVAAPQAQIVQPLQQVSRALYVASTPYAYRSSSAPATSYQYANHWNSHEQSAAGVQARYSMISPQQYSVGYQQPQYDSAIASQGQNSGQYVAAQDEPCEK